MFQAFFILFAAALFAAPQYAYAILPPDFIFSVGYQFVQFFSMIALVVGGVAGSLVLIFQRHINFLHRHLYTVIGGILLLLTTSILGIFFLQERANNKIYLEQIESLNKQIKDVGNVVSTVSSSTNAYATSTDSEGNWETLEDARKLFMSDALYLYANNAGSPFYLEVDLNRRQVPNGKFMHYYYTVGSFDGLDKYDHDLLYSSSMVPVSTKSVKSVKLVQFSDLSTRQEYKGTIGFDEVRISFTALNLEGDFITRNSPTYTRHQSVGDGVVTYNNKKLPVHVLAEGIHSSDFSKSIFFEGSSDRLAETRQFSLWDSEGNFYMVDQSKVFSETPAYPSHTWLLYKNHKDKYTKKGFTSIITAQAAPGRQETEWSITAPDFNDATIKLSLLKYIDDGDSQKRMRALVGGTITDESGQREINGFAFIIK